MIIYNEMNLEKRNLGEIYSKTSHFTSLVTYRTNEESASTLTKKSTELPGSKHESDITPDLYTNFEPSINVESMPTSSVCSEYNL